MEALVRSFPDDLDWIAILKDQFRFMDPNLIQGSEDLVSKTKILEMVREFKKKGAVFPTPIIATQIRRPDGTMVTVVLDGNHRLEASKIVGLKFVPVIMLDWNNLESPDVWHRAFVAQHSQAVAGLIDRWVRNNMLTSLEDWNQDISKDQTVITFRDKKYVFRQSGLSTLRQHKRVAYFFGRLESLGEKVVNVTQTLNDILELWNDQQELRKKSWVTVRMPRFSKEDLGRHFIDGVILPPKAFQTKLPINPLALPFRVSLLKDPGDFTETQLKAKFWKELKHVKIKDVGKIRNISPLDDFYFGAQYIAFADLNQESQFFVIHFSAIKDLWSSHHFLDELSRNYQGRIFSNFAMMDVSSSQIVKMPEERKTGGIDLNNLNVEARGGKGVLNDQSHFGQLAGSIPFGLKPQIVSIGSADIVSFLNMSAVR